MREQNLRVKVQKFMPSQNKPELDCVSSGLLPARIDSVSEDLDMAFGIVCASLFLFSAVKGIIK